MGSNPTLSANCPHCQQVPTPANRLTINGRRVERGLGVYTKSCTDGARVPHQLRERVVRQRLPHSAGKYYRSIAQATLRILDPAPCRADRVKTDNMSDFHDELRIGRQLESFGPMRRQRKRAPDAYPGAGLRHATKRRSSGSSVRSSSSTRRVGRQSPLHDPGNAVTPVRP